MPIFFKGRINNIESEKTPPEKQTFTFEQLKKRAFIQQPKKPTSDQQSREIINKQVIRPSHIEDESIQYQSSQYLRDLIEEGK